MGVAQDYEASCPLDQLHAHPRNYRAHPPDQLEHLAASLTEHGVYRNVVVTTDGTILAGHGVVEAARHLGWETIPVVRLTLDPEDPRAIKVLVADNEVSNLAVSDDRELAELLRELADEDLTGLLGTGYDQLSLAALVYTTRDRGELAHFDAAAEWVGLPGFEAPPHEHQLTVKFVDRDDRDRFLELIGSPRIHFRAAEDRIWTTWWPDKPRVDLAAVRYE